MTDNTFSGGFWKACLAGERPGSVNEAQVQVQGSGAKQACLL
uniref:Uncharacterized protein n=1 Tax=Anguilla anguilla TaxID=7936 RepID=A0A0E9UP75_ANGAN